MVTFAMIFVISSVFLKNIMYTFVQYIGYNFKITSIHLSKFPRVLSYKTIHIVNHVACSVPKNERRKVAGLGQIYTLIYFNVWHTFFEYGWWSLCSGFPDLKLRAHRG